MMLGDKSCPSHRLRAVPPLSARAPRSLQSHTAVEMDFLPLSQMCCMEHKHPRQLLCSSV